MKRTSKVIALSLALTMCFATVVLASGPITSPEDGVSVQLSIHKQLIMPRETTTPVTTFRFDAERISVDGVATPEARTTMPDLNTLKTLSVNYVATDTGTLDADTNLVTIPKQTEDLFAGVNFPHAGVYIYRITEAPNTNTEIDGNKPHEILNYSQAVFELEVHVANNEAGTARYVRYVVIRDVTPDEEGNPPTAERKVGQLLFINDYVKTNTVTEPGNNSTVDISKTVTGDLGNRDMLFDFSMTLTPPILVTPTPAFYKAYVVAGTAVLTDITENAAGSPTDSDAMGPYIRISTSGATNFRLKHGQRLVFVDTPVGTEYTVTEAATQGGHISSVIVTMAGETVTTENNTLTNVERPTGQQFVGEPTNSAAFTNRRDSVVPTGVNMNDLPFLGLIVLPIGALIGFVGIKSRRKNYTAGR